MYNISQEALTKLIDNQNKFNSLLCFKHEKISHDITIIGILFPPSLLLLYTFQLKLILCLHELQSEYIEYNISHTSINLDVRGEVVISPYLCVVRQTRYMEKKYSVVYNFEGALRYNRESVCQDTFPNNYIFL